MKSMKGLSMNKMLGSIKRKGTGSEEPAGPSGDHPDAVAARCVRQFCESGGPGTSGDEVTFLPPIVDAAESSPAAAAECARLIRKYLNKDYFSKASFQYNAIMLLRILSDNPGPTFTRNLDKKFIDVTKDLLRTGRNLNVRQLLMETLDDFENTKASDAGLAGIIEMWKKEKEKAYKTYGGQPPPPPGPRALNAPAPFDGRTQNYFARDHNSRRLPDPIELASRLEEARTSAKLLDQVVTCTPPSEFLSNDLVREFADRCQSAARSLQGYMAAENPGPDNDTMESLIDTNEQLQQALNQHQRALLNAKKQLGLGERSAQPTPPPHPPANGPVPYGSAWTGAQASSSRPELNTPPLPPLPSRSKPPGNGKGKEVEPVGLRDGAPPPVPVPRPDRDEDPFRDPPAESSSSSVHRLERPGVPPDTPDAPRLAFEPFHPGFNTTPSYLLRQDSAMNKLTMHGATSPPSRPAASDPAPAANGKRPTADDDDLYDNEDAQGYPVSKEPEASSRS